MTQALANPTPGFPRPRAAIQADSQAGVPTPPQDRAALPEVPRQSGGAAPGKPGQPARPGADEEPDERGRAILDFERKWWKYAGAKEQAIRELFDMSATRYYQVLNALIDTPGALAYDPILVKRLRRMREARQQARGSRQTAAIPINRL